MIAVGKLKRAVVAALIVMAGALPIVAPAYAALIGPPVQLSDGWSWWPSCSYNPHSDRYLLMWDYPKTSWAQFTGRMVSPATGAVVGSDLVFPVYGLSSIGTAAYNPLTHEWMVAYQVAKQVGVDDQSDLYTQRVNSDGSFNGAYYRLEAPEWQDEAEIDYSTVSDTYLLVWRDSRGGVYNVRGMLLGADGRPAPGATEIRVSDATLHRKSDGRVAYNPVANEYLVVWTDARNWDGVTQPDQDYGDIYAQRYNAATGAAIGGNFPVYWGGSPYVPDGNDIVFDIVCNTSNGNYLVVWTHNYGTAMGIVLSSSGTPLYGGAFAVHAGWCVGAAYNPKYDTYFITYEHDATKLSGQRYSSTAQPIAGTVPIFSLTEADITDGCLAMRPSDGQHIQFIQRHHPYYTIHAQRFAPDVAPVSSFTATPQGTSNQLSWTASVDPHVEGYRVRYKTTGYPTGPDDGTVVTEGACGSGSGGSFAHTGLSGPVTCYYAAFLRDGIPTYSPSVQASARPDGYPGTPIVTAPSLGAAVATRTPTISWTGTDHNAFQVRLSQKNDPSTYTNGRDSGTVSSSSSSWVPGLLRECSRYYAFVRQRNAVGWGDWSILGHSFVVNTLPVDQVFYAADALPSAGGWSVYDTGSVENGPQVASSVVSDMGANAWRLVDGSSVYRCKENYAVTNVSFDTGACVAARIRATAIAGNAGYNLGISNGNVGGMFVSVGASEARLMDGSESVAASYPLDGTVYHKYHLTVKNATVGSNSTALWKVYVDGVLRMSWTGAGTPDGSDGFFAGHSGTAATGTWHFDWIAGRSDGAWSPPQWDPAQPELNAPGGPSVVTDDGLYTGSLSKLHCSWSSVSAAARYRCCVGTSPGASDARGWTDVNAPTTEVSLAGLSLTEGATYYFTVESGNGSGAWSAGTSSNGITAPMGVSIQQAKSLANGQVRSVRGKDVSAVFSGCFYVQELGNPFGLKVLSGAAVIEGSVVDLAGTMLGQGSERYLDCTGSKVEVR